MQIQTPITPCLWFDTQAEEAVTFYTRLFPDSRVDHTLHYGPNMHQPEGSVLLVEFSLAGQSFQALNGGPHHHFNDAISLSVLCADQAEVDRLWDALTTDGGTPVQCGWLRDKFGLSWQIVPRRWWELTRSSDKAAVQRAFMALMGMVKLDVAALEKAFAGH
jgi:predicted 3-demethylubiquinone-9 3-methyltransferase (glyoxalase superfamily)